MPEAAAKPISEHPSDSSLDGSAILPQNARWRWRPVVLLVFIALLLRVVGLAHFPVMETDEGLWTWSSKNFVLYHDWFLDGHTHLFLSPLFHAVTVPLFAGFGPSISLARVISAVGGALSVALVYMLTWRLARTRSLALSTALILAFSQWSLVMSRKALIESFELFVILACAVLATYDGLAALIAAGIVLGLVGLTKANGLFMAIPLGLLVLERGAAGDRSSFRSGRAWRSLVIFGVVAVLVSAVVYGGLYHAHPTEFRRAFLFELDGVHFESLSRPLFRLGRFGLDPAQAGRTIIMLYREEPFLFVLATIGLAILPTLRTSGARFFATWLLVGAPYFLLQMYQPIRYFYLLLPALAFFAALTIHAMNSRPSDATEVSGKIGRVALSVFLCFDLAYGIMNAVTNRNTQFVDVRAWVAANTRPDDRILSSGLLSTDLPRPVYTYYHLIKRADGIDPVVRQIGIRYVILDDLEWPAAYKAEVASRYRKLFQGLHSAVYGVTP